MHEAPAHEARPRLAAPPATPAAWHYAPPRAAWWHSPLLRAGALATVLLLCGLNILALVHEQTGPQGFLVGIGLGVLPVPLLIAAFRWIDRVEPVPRRNLVFAFAWGSCAATLMAIVANGFATEWLATTGFVHTPSAADTLGSTLVAPVVEETAKSAAIWLLFLHRPREFDSIVSGVVVAGITATGFAFTENILYLGSAFGEDQALGYTGLESTTATTFFMRIVMSPFAHPLFTVLTGIAFGVAAVTARRHRLLRGAVPLLGLAAAITLHAVWNGAASLPLVTFVLVYAMFMIPVFVLITWLAIWSRQHDLRTVRATLPLYAAAGWFAAPEPYALASMRARALARSLARRTHGRRAARTVAEYHHFATTLALLRARADAGAPDPDFTARERELLHHLWHRHPVAGPPTASAALTTLPPHNAGDREGWGRPPGAGRPGYGAYR